MSVKEEIQAEAKNLGFSLIGFTNLEYPPSFPFFLTWIQAGRAAGMQYLADERSQRLRSNPEEVFPPAKTIISLAMPYWNPELAPLKVLNASGRVAAYAWGNDYHLVIPARLEMLAVKIERIIGTIAKRRAFTDSAPILEKDIAQRAGSGWIGKNTCLISPGLGSYFFLAELFIDHQIEPDEPFKTDRCGTCRRCIEACPTGCIRSDRTLDAGACISYLTIENKGPIPRTLRHAMGNWIFGCDICQIVCPWNQRFSPMEGDPAFAPIPEIQAPRLDKEIRLLPAEFNLKFQHSPIKRAKRKGYLRNICVALGNSGEVEAVKGLSETLLNEPEPLVRAHAAWALGKIRGSMAEAALRKSGFTETDPTVMEEITLARHS